MVIVPQSAILAERPVPETPLGILEKAARLGFDCPAPRTALDAEVCLRELVRAGRGTVLEHTFFSVYIVTDLNTSHELVRMPHASHRLQDPCYVCYNDSIPVICPFAEEDRKAGNYFRWESAVTEAETAYLGMLRDGVPGETAQSVLPACTAVTLLMTADAMEWRAILTQGLVAGLDSRLHELSGLIMAELRKAVPVVFDL